MILFSFVYQFHDAALGSDCFTMSFDSYEGHYGVNIFIPCTFPWTMINEHENIRTEQV